MSIIRKLTVGIISYRFDEMLDKTIRSLGDLPNEVDIIIQVADGAESEFQLFKSRYDSIIQQLQMRILPLGDSGIFNAMNKIRLAATAEYLWFINAGDEMLADLPLDQILTTLTEPRSYGFRSAQMQGHDLFIRPASRYTDPTPRQIGHVASIYHRSAYTEIAYNEHLPVSSDQDFTERCFNHSGWCYIPQIIGVFPLGGVSSAYHLADFKVYRNESLLLRAKFLAKMLLRLLVGTKWLHRILLFRKCDRLDSRQQL
jgi:hypothetical protein